MYAKKSPLVLWGLNKRFIHPRPVVPYWECSSVTSEGLGEMFKGDFADMYAHRFPLMLMGAAERKVKCD